MKSKIPFYFIDELVVRSPVYPFQKDLSEARIYQLLNDDFFLEAIYVASPLLYEESMKLKDGIVKTEKEKNKILFSLHKYLNRMQTRSTPFGLFSTCGVGTWDGSLTTKTLSSETFSRHTRLDMHFLQKIIAYVAGLPQLQNHIKFYPNNSIYTVGSEIRYVEYQYKNGLRQYKLSAITSNQYISAILKAAKKGIFMSEMLKVMVNDCNIPEDDSKKFIEELVSSQVINSEFEVSLTNRDDFTAQIQKHLNTLYHRSGIEHIRHLSELFTSIINDINNLDDANSNHISCYKKIIEKLKELEPNMDEAKTFHIDAYRVHAGIKVNENVKSDLLELFSYLKKINRRRYEVNDKIEAFKRKFINRYEYQSVLLAEVLDSDFGIGYPVDKNLSTGSLVSDIPFSHEEKDSVLSLNSFEKWLLAILRDPNNKNASSIALDQQHQPDYEDDDTWDGLPPSLSAMFRILNDEKETISFEYFFGPSAASVIARFSHGNEEIKSVVEKITRKEEETMENCLLAEIVHMPDNRITNVIMHPPFRKHEIPFLAAPSVGEDQVVGIEDLFVKIENNEIIVFSKRLNKRIIPCKTHVHNHFGNTLPLYHFLGDLQNEGISRSINFSWGSLTQLLLFLPRITYKNIILSPATWRLPQAAFDFETDDTSELLIHVERTKQHYSIPDKVLYAEGDNELLVDFKNQFSVLGWLNTIRNKSSIVLKEFLWSDTGDGKQHLHQYIATLINENKRFFPNPASDSALHTQEEGVGTQRVYEQGSEWLYLKLYCGSASSDLLLSRLIQPLIKDISSKKLIKKCFFIKYVDSDYHIRLRFHLNDASDTGVVISIINKHLDQSRDKSLVYKIVYDMYIREIERYGGNTIELCESIFYIDSIITLELLKIFQSDKKEIMKSLWGMKMVDDFLNSCEFSLKEKADFVDVARKGFAKEFGSNKQTLDKINNKYNTYKNTIKEIMLDGSKNKVVYHLLRQKNEMITPIISQLMILSKENKLEVNAFYILSSLIHMMLNRLITHQERIHEFLIYEFLTKHYTMLKHLNKSENMQHMHKKEEVIG